MNDVWIYPTTGGGGWTLLVPSGSPPGKRSAHTAVFDGAGNRMLVFGGQGVAGPLSDAWSLSLAGTPAWSSLSPSGGPPSARYDHTAILDAPRNRMVLHGGTDGSTAVNDVWALSLGGSPAWSPLSPTGGPPPPNYTHTAVVDAARDRMLVFGGSTSVVWALALAGSPAWSSVGASGAPPATGVAVFDAARDRMLVAQGAPTTVHALFLSGTPAWGSISTPSGPAGRSAAAAAFDSGNDRWIMAAGSFENDVHALSFPNLFSLNVAVSPSGFGSVQQDPVGGCHAPGTMVTLTAVPSPGRSFVNWGGDASGSTNPITVTMNAAKNIVAHFSTYTVNVTIAPAGAGTVTKDPNQATYQAGTQVTLTASNSPTPFVSWGGDAGGTSNPLVITVDGPKNITANFLSYTLSLTASPASGGSTSSSPVCPCAAGSSVTLGATAAMEWAFDGWSGDLSGSQNPAILLMDADKSVTANFIQPGPTCGDWAPILTATRPAARYGPAGVWDPVRHRLLVCGGRVGLSNLSDVWQLTTGGTPAWTQLLPNGPNPRSNARLVYDPVRDRMLMFGGFVFVSHGATSNEVWELTLAGTPTWNQLSPSGTIPPARAAFSMIYDPVRDRMIVFGGSSTLGALNDTWALSLSGSPAWAQLAPGGTPPSPRHGHSAIYDPVRDRMTVFGGAGGTGVWELSLSGTPTWNALNPRGTTPDRLGHEAVYDPLRDRMIVLAGVGGSGVPALSFSGQGWRMYSPGGATFDPQSGFVAVYEPDLDVVLTFGGVNTNATMRLDLGPGPTLAVAGEHGSVEITPLELCYSMGANVSLLASNDVAYHFNQWLGDASGTDNPLQVTMNASKSIIAEFVYDGVTNAEEPALVFGLGRIHPNPARGAIRIEYSLAEEARVSLGIYDLAGRRVARLVDGVHPAGRHVATWERQTGGSGAPGLYYVRFETPHGTWVRRVARLR